MTVNELRELLDNFDDDMLVMVGEMVGDDRDVFDIDDVFQVDSKDLDEEYLCLEISR